MEPIHMNELCEILYRLRTAQSGKMLEDLFLRIEVGYFRRWDPDAIKKAHNLDVPEEFMGWGLFARSRRRPITFANCSRIGKRAYPTKTSTSAV